MTKRLKSILKKRPKIERESKKNFMKRKIKFNDKKNEEKIFFLTDLERYEKVITWLKILRNVDYLIEDI